VKNTFVVSGLLLVLALLLAGCGSDDSEPLSRAEFKKQANAICSQGEKERLSAINRSVEEAGGGAAAENKRLMDLIRNQLVPIASQTYDEISELDSPEGDEEKVQRMLASFEEGVQELRDNPVKALRENSFLQADSLAKAYGLDSCVI
jgi:hypothetical protein